jgi:hypothetical protein
MTKRGFTYWDLNEIGYRGLSHGVHPLISNELYRRHGSAVCDVPGFYLGPDHKALLVEGAVGMVIPVRDVRGWPVALKIRRPDAGVGPKYRWLSSVKQGGNSPGCPCHVPRWGRRGEGPLFIPDPVDRVRIVESELAADLLTIKTGVLTLAVSGVSNWRKVLPVLDYLRKRERLDSLPVTVAFDWKDVVEGNQGVLTAFWNCTQALDEMGFDVGIEHWDPEHKGPDDAWVAGSTLHEKWGIAAVQDLLLDHYAVPEVTGA